MIRVYLDWNVMAQMKDGHLDDLLTIICQKNRFFIPYSTSHIGDILASNNEEDPAQKERIGIDLDYITSLTDNNCLSNDGKQVNLDISEPHSLFHQRIENEDLLNDFGLGKIEELFEVEGIPQGIGDTFISLLKSIPIDESFIAAMKNPETSLTLRKLFPDLGENPTMEGFFRSFGKMYKNLNEEEGYKVFREITQDGLGINRDKIYNNDDPYGLIETIHSKLGYKWDEYVDHSKYAPEWFNRITNEYLKLDMHGYQEDKVEVKPNKRKQTFANTTEDGSHAAFASTCHFYITNDKKSCAKTNKVYEKLNINTKVFRPQEFIDYYIQFIGNSYEYIGENLQTIVEIINGNDFEEMEIENGIRRIYQTQKFIFDFFNGITRQWEIPSGEQKTMLFRNMPTNLQTTYAFEVRNLVNRIDPDFCKDTQNLSVISDEAILNDNWGGIRWRTVDIELRLLGYQGNIQMYINVIDDGDSSD